MWPLPFKFKHKSTLDCRKIQTEEGKKKDQIDSPH